jgi:hypothetical protein
LPLKGTGLPASQLGAAPRLVRGVWLRSTAFEEVMQRASGQLSGAGPRSAVRTSAQESQRMRIGGGHGDMTLRHGELWYLHGMSLAPAQARSRTSRWRGRGPRRTSSSSPATQTTSGAYDLCEGWVSYSIYSLALALSLSLRLSLGASERRRGRGLRLMRTIYTTAMYRTVGPPLVHTPFSAYCMYSIALAPFMRRGLRPVPNQKGGLGALPASKRPPFPHRLPEDSDSAAVPYNRGARSGAGASSTGTGTSESRERAKCVSVEGERVARTHAHARTRARAPARPPTFSGVFDLHKDPGRGVLLRPSLGPALRDLGLAGLGPDALDAAFLSLDRNGDGSLDPAEFREAAAAPMELQQWADGLGLPRLLAYCLAGAAGAGAVAAGEGAAEADPLRGASGLGPAGLEAAVGAFGEGVRRLLGEAVGELRRGYEALEAAARARAGAEGAGSKFSSFKMACGSVEEFHKGMQDRIGGQELAWRGGNGRRAGYGDSRGASC